ncbi:hypothetical protein [Aequorivita nionensis]|uniref:hypothetical protein n=1 Tax=Aequorivita nionensis TaxID=1287690 RepID=UPI003965A0FD
MPKIDKDLNFKPSKSVQKLWFNSKKAEKNYSGVRLPGFYGTSGFALDAVLFVIMLGLEVLGVYNLLIVGDLAIIMAMGLIALDIIFAFMAHANHANKLININYSIIATDSRQQQNFKQQANGLRKVISYIGKFGIVGLAIFKIAAFQGLLGYFNGLSLFIIATYLVVAYIHLYHTGYFLYEVIASIAFNRQKSKFIGGNKDFEVAEETPFTHDFSTTKELKEFEANHRRLYMDKGKHTDDKFHFVIESPGIFDDEDVSLFVGHQKNENRAELAVECLKFQMSIYGSSN